MARVMPIVPVPGCLRREVLCCSGGSYTQESYRCTFSFGKRNGISSRRTQDCMLLQESEMIVVSKKVVLLDWQPDFNAVLCVLLVKI